MTPVMVFMLAVVVAAFAGFVRGFSGFGSAMVMSPAFSVLFGPLAGIPSLSLIDLPALLYLLPEAWRHGEWRSVALLGLAAICMVPVGAWLLVHVNQELMQRVIGLLVLGFVTILIVGWRYRRTVSTPLTLGVGAASGLLGGAMGTSGPPIVLFFLSGPAEARPARASIMGFFVFTNAMGIASYAFYGLYTSTVLVRGASLAPVYFVGVWLGNRMFGRVSETTFRRVALAVLAGVGFAAVVA